MACLSLLGSTQSPGGEEDGSMLGLPLGFGTVWVLLFLSLSHLAEKLARDKPNLSCHFFFCETKPEKQLLLRDFAAHTSNSLKKYQTTVGDSALCPLLQQCTAQPFQIWHRPPNSQDLKNTGSHMGLTGLYLPSGSWAVKIYMQLILSPQHCSKHHKVSARMEQH